MDEVRAYVESKKRAAKPTPSAAKRSAARPMPSAAKRSAAKPVAKKRTPKKKCV